MLKDYALTQLSQEMRSRLHGHSEESWFSSLGFAESYCFPPAERVCFLEDNAGKILSKCFYRERKWAGLFNELEVMGLIDPQNDLLRELQVHRRSSLVCVRWVGDADLPRDKGVWHSQSVKRLGEDPCIELPQSPSDYLHSLGSKARKHFPYYVRRLDREWGKEWVFDYQFGKSISRDDYDRLLDLNSLRMREKGRSSGWTQNLREHRWNLARQCGLLCTLKYQNGLVGGTFSFVHANEAYLIVIAHHPQFNSLNLGTVSLWLTIQNLINAGYRRYHLMWGNSFYKEQFGGHEKPLYNVTFFANPIISRACRAADFVLVPRVWRLVAKIWKRLSWNLPVSDQGKANHKHNEVAVNVPPIRVTRD